MSSVEDTKFPERLRDLLNGKAGTRGKTTQAELAAYLGIPNRSSIAGYANGNNEPGLERIVKIATYFGVSTDWLMGLSDVEACGSETREKTEEVMAMEAQRIARLRVYGKLLFMLEQEVDGDMDIERLAAITKAMEAVRW